MENNKNSKISHAIEILKTEVREGKALGKPFGKLLDKNANNCYILSILREVGIKDFESEAEMTRIINFVAEKIAIEIVRRDTNELNKCDLYEIEKKS